MKQTSNHIKLGAFVALGTALLIATLYIIGSKKNLFNKTISVYVTFNHVNGLLQGNNVRFAGIAIGTVKDVSIVNDSMVVVEMIIREDAMRYVRKSSLADIGSDGLMGNKLINLSTPDASSPFVEAGDTLRSAVVIATDEMMRTLNTTNENVLVISSDLRKITRRIQESSAFWDLIADSASAENVRRTLKNIETASTTAERLTFEAESLISGVEEGRGLAGKLLNDEQTARDFENLMSNLKASSDTAKLALHHMHEFMEDLNITPGPLGILARDTVMGKTMIVAFENLETSTSLLNDNLKAMQSSFLFRKYFRKKEKAKEKTP
jgi:phospholipid/cholesterol/gamma-HCH transport system substrate-binding protein